MVLRGASKADEDVQLWATIRDQLRQIDDLQDRIGPLQEEYERARAALDAGIKVEAEARPFEEVRGELNPLLTRARDLSENTMEKVDILQALLTSSGDGFDTGRKRRRVEASSPGPTLLSNNSRTASPALSPVAEKLPEKKKVQRRSQPPPGKGITSAGTASLPTNTANTLSSLGGWTDPAKARREQLSSQLPLQKGRKVAFRQPLAKGESHSPDDGETWIMAAILECINNDRNRYVVKDADPDTETTYNTTLKAIVPLPESPETLPAKDYPVGHDVLAVYPDTSCFYRAIVKGGGPGLKGDKNRRASPELLNATYQLTFEDDDDDVKSVPAYLVVERPRV